MKEEQTRWILKSSRRRFSQAGKEVAAEVPLSIEPRVKLSELWLIHVDTTNEMITRLATEEEEVLLASLSTDTHTLLAGVSDLVLSGI